MMKSFQYKYMLTAGIVSAIYTKSINKISKNIQII
jgi:hypothetical protein